MQHTYFLAGLFLKLTVNYLDVPYKCQFHPVMTLAQRQAQAAIALFPSQLLAVCDEYLPVTYEISAFSVKIKLPGNQRVRGVISAQTTKGFFPQDIFFLSSMLTF